MESSTLNALQTELEFYRQNQVEVEEEIKMLIADNQQLSQKVAVLLKEKVDNERHAHNNNDEHDTEIEDLKRQVALLIKERDSLHILWQTSQKTIDALETELKTYQCYNNRGNQNDVNDERRELELKLETALTDYIELETKYKELRNKHNTLENEMKKVEKEVASYKERGKDMEQKTNEAMKSLQEYKINLNVEKKRNEDLKHSLALSQKECADRLKKESDARSKVAEALQLYDSVVVQKNQAYKTIQELTAELTQLKHTLSNVRRDAESNCRKEMDEAKEKYNEKVTDMLEHIKNLDSELVEKGLLLNKALRENKILQEANEGFMKQQKENLKSLDPKLAVAEQRLEAMFQELVTSERRNIQVVCEKQCLAIDIQRIQDIHSREIKRRDWEESLLKTQCEELKVQVEHLQKSLEETHHMVNKLQNMLASRTELNHKMVSSKEEELVELNKHLENQIDLSKKWKESYLEMSAKLKKRLKDLQKENNELRGKLNLPHNYCSHEDSTSS